VQIGGLTGSGLNFSRETLKRHLKSEATLPHAFRGRIFAVVHQKIATFAEKS
jgi:hypothetical protein